MKCTIFFLIFSVAALGSCEDILKHVIVIFRHGDRNKLFDFPGDLNTGLSKWPGGYGELLKEGKQRHYKMGQYFRQRYSDFLPTTYSRYDLLVKSTDVDRTIMSAASHLAGLYPPPEDQKIDPDLNWQPIPIHVIPENQDNLLAMDKPCSNFSDLYEEYKKSDKMAKINEEAKEVYETITEKTKIHVDSIEKLLIFYDTFNVEHERNYELPDWVNSTFLDMVNKVGPHFFSLWSATSPLARLKTGPLFDYIIKDFQNASLHDDASYQKYKIMSAHDTTVGNVLNTLGVYKTIRPPYASAVIFELRKKNGNHVVNVLYKDTTSDENRSAEPQHLEIKRNDKTYDFDIKLEDFVSALGDVVIEPKVWETECAPKKKLFGLNKEWNMWNRLAYQKDEVEKQNTIVL